MPIYEYDCESCGKRTEVIQNYKDKPPKGCPHCGGKLKKAFSAPAIQFKGSGWYITDYARGKTGEKAEGTKEGKESKEGKEGKEAKEEKREKKEEGSVAGRSEKADTTGKPAEKKKETKSKKTGADS
jgi:putative FmdB family regulatory protein